MNTSSSFSEEEIRYRVRGDVKETMPENRNVSTRNRYVNHKAIER